MRVKYNRISSLSQTGNRFSADKENYDLTLLDKISGTIPFRDRPQAKILISQIESGIVKEVIVEELSRLGRHTGDCITTLEWMEKKGVNVTVRNLGIQSRPNGEKNPIWNVITSVISSMYSLELDSIRERTTAGRSIYLARGGVLGRPKGTNESEKDFLNKAKNKKIIELLNKGWTLRQISKQLDTSSATIQKVKNKLNWIICG